MIGTAFNFQQVAEMVRQDCGGSENGRPTAAECCQRFEESVAEAENTLLKLMASDGEYKPVPPLSLFGVELAPDALEEEDAAPVAYIHISESEVYASLADGLKTSELRHAHATAWYGEGDDRSPCGGSVKAGDLHVGDVVVFFHINSTTGNIVGACCCKVQFVVSAQ